MHKLGIYHGGFGDCPNDYVQPHIKWCRNNINGHWMVEPPHVTEIENGREINLNYTFEFENETDAMAFKLRWL